MSAAAVAEAGAPAEQQGSVTFAANVLRRDLQEAMRVAWRQNRSKLPILDNVLLEARAPGSLIVRSYDYSGPAVSIDIQAVVAEPGHALVPGRLLARALRAMPLGPISIEASGDSVRILGGGASVTCTPNGAPGDYPVAKPIIDGSEIVMPSDELAGYLRACLPAVGAWGDRPILSGVGMSVHEGRWEFFAADGFRLVVVPGPLAARGAPDTPLVLDAETLRRVLPLLRGEPFDVALRWSESRTRFEFALEDVVIQGERIQGTYPNYRPLIPQEHAWSVQLPAVALAAAVRMVSIVEPAGIRLTFAPSTGLALRSHATDGGEAATASLLAGVTVMAGGDPRVALEPRYLLDALQLFAGDVVITGQAPDKPVMFSAPDGSGPRAVVMPMFVQWDE